jgi:hypothetical protein
VAWHTSTAAPRVIVDDVHVGPIQLVVDRQQATAVATWLARPARPPRAGAAARARWRWRFALAAVLGTPVPSPVPRQQWSWPAMQRRRVLMQQYSAAYRALVCRPPALEWSKDTGSLLADHARVLAHLLGAPAAALCRLLVRAERLDDGDGPSQHAARQQRRRAAAAAWADLLQPAPRVP